MGVMDKLKIFVVQEPVVAISVVMAGCGLFLPAVVRPILDSFETAEQVPQPALSDAILSGLPSIEEDTEEENGDEEDDVEGKDEDEDEKGEKEKDKVEDENGE